MNPSMLRLTLACAALFLALEGVSMELSAHADDKDITSREARKKNPLTPDEKNLAAAKALYQKHCADCHGARGNGDGKCAVDLDPKPSDLTVPDMARRSDGALFWRISRGRRPMPAFEKLTREDERWLLVLYLRTLSKK